jgi:hypothetical protein
MMHVRKTVLTAAFAVALALSSGGVASAEPVPAGWEITATKTGSALTWHAPDRVRPGDAMVEFYAGDRLLGRPRAAQDQRSFRLDLDGVAARNLTGLQVRAAGRRLDAAPDAAGPSARAAVPLAAALPPNPVDPGTAGPYATITGEYHLADVSLPGYPQPVEMQGVVVAPQGTTGQRPLVLLLHGRHDTCYTSTASRIEWPCASGYQPIPSYRGYLQAQQLLASQGYVTVSISANGVNGQDGSLGPPDDGGAQARSSLVRLHLAHWADWAGAGRATAPDVVRSAPVADMTKVLLFGHSRGGEGVNRAALDSLTPPPAAQDGYHGAVLWQIKGTAHIGPTAVGQDPAADVPSMTILPGCDGDISDLQGEMYVDGTRGVSRGVALHSAAYVVGANHNFFNTEWTPAQATARVAAFDDYIGHDPTCTSTSTVRLTYQQEQTVGATYLAAAAHVFLDGDDTVRPLLDGSGFRAPSADPARVLTHAVGANRAALLLPASTVTASGTGARLCQQIIATGGTACLTGGRPDSPHFVPFGPVRPEAGRYAVAVTWTQPGTRTSFRPAQSVSLTGSTSLAMRVIVAPDTVGTQVEVAITDTSGRRGTLGQFTLDGLASSTFTAANWAQEVRLSLSPATAAGVNLGRVAALELVPRSAAGEVCVMDAWGWRTGTPAPQPAALPRVDLGELTVNEGNSGSTTYHVPARVSGSGSGQVRVFVVDPATNLATDSLVTVPAGSTTIDIPITVTGNTVHADDRTYLVAVKAVRGTEVGDAYGALAVHDDDPAT